MPAKYRLPVPVFHFWPLNWQQSSTYTYTLHRTSNNVNWIFKSMNITASELQHRQKELTHPTAWSLCDTWATCHILRARLIYGEWIPSLSNVSERSVCHNLSQSGRWMYL